MSTSADSEGLEEPLVSQGRGYREFDTKLKEEAKAIMENNKGQQIKNKIDETKGMLIENIDKVLQRHTSIEVICRETESLRETSASFKGGAKNLRRRAIWNDVKCKLLMGVGVLVLILIILMWACNPNFSKCH